MKNLSIVCLALLVLATCCKKENEPIPVESVSLLPTVSIVVNDTYELKAVISPINAADKSLTWNSDKSDFATVDQNGVVTGKAVGKAVITVTSKSYPDKSAKCEVQVVKEKVASITIAPEKPRIAKGETLELKATVLPADAAQAVTWSSGDETKATIDPNTGVATGKEVGTTVITATATDGSGLKGEVTLTVQNERATATITDITLGAEKFVVKVPEPGPETSTTLDNAPHTIVANRAEVQVNITATEGAVIKIGEAVFTSGQKVSFNLNPSVTFSVTEEGKTGSKEYTLTITPYDKESNPYGIYTVAHLHDVRNGLGKGFKLMNDLTMPEAEFPGIDDYKDEGWLPIGGESNPFTGSLNGAGRKIENLYANRKALVYVGLFGKVGTDAFIKNLKVNAVDQEKRGVGGSNRSGHQYSGILAGYSEGTIEDCYTSGKSFSTAITTGSSHVGGLVGYAKGRISKCYAMGAAFSSATDGEASDSFAGGLVGYSEATINDCYTKGAVYAFAMTAAASSFAGGLVGYSTGSTINRCYATGEIFSQSSSTVNTKGAYTGGLLGLINDSRINNCYALGNSVATTTTTSTTYAIAGGLSGQINANCSVSNSYAAGGAASNTARDRYVGSLSGRHENGFTFSHCYRNSNANIRRGGIVAVPDDEETTGLTPKTFVEMKTDAFRDNLNEGQSATVWGLSAGKNSGFPYIIDVGDGK